MTTGKKYWHVFGREETRGELAGVYVTIVAGPTIKKPEALSAKKTMGMDFLASFDHEPSDLEKDQCQPRAFREYNPDGTEIDWEAYAYDSALECQRGGFHKAKVDEHGNCLLCGHPEDDPEDEIRAAIASITGGEDA